MRLGGINRFGKSRGGKARKEIEEGREKYREMGKCGESEKKRGEVGGGGRIGSIE